MKYIRKQYNILIIAFIFTTTIGFGQVELEDYPILQKKLEQIEAQKIAFITQQLKLTPESAQQFWPVYNQHHEKKRSLEKAFKSKRDAYGDFASITEEEAREIGDAIIVHERQMLDLKKEYYKNLKEVLSPKQILILYRSEDKFKRMLLEKIRDVRKKHPRGR